MLYSGFTPLPHTVQSATQFLYTDRPTFGASGFVWYTSRYWCMPASCGNRYSKWCACASKATVSINVSWPFSTR